MDMVCKHGQMVQSMKVIGKMTLLMVQVNFIIQMEIYMRELGRMIKLMDMEFIIILMVQYT